MNNDYLCCKCNEILIMQNVSFTYLGRDFSSEILKCPSCGQVFIPESLVKDKMAYVEQALEGK